MDLRLSGSAIEIKEVHPQKLGVGADGGDAAGHRDVWARGRSRRPRIQAARRHAEHEQDQEQRGRGQFRGWV